MENVTHRLQRILTALNLSVLAFETQLGVGKGAINKPLKNHTGFSVNVLVTIGEKFPNVNMDWLINGRGSMFLNKSPFLISNLEESLKDFLVFLDKQGHQTDFMLNPIEEFVSIELAKIGMTKEAAVTIAAESPGNYERKPVNEWKEKYYDLLEKYAACLEQTQSQTGLQGGGKKTVQSHAASSMG